MTAATEIKIIDGGGSKIKTFVYRIICRRD
jgi:hypothetical protein